MFSAPILALGFRPFFLLAGAMATLWVPLWLAVWRGLLPVPAYFGPIGWHRHEMLFGYTLAVIAGFLLTAAGNWTGRTMPRGGLLAGLIALWAVPRLGLFFSALLPLPVAALLALLDVAFPLAVAAALLPPLWGQRSFGNLAFVPLLAGLAAANAIVHGQALGWLPADADLAALATRFTLDLVVLIMVVMGGRVIPFFTGRALPETRPRRNLGTDRAAVGLVAALLVADWLPLAWPGAEALRGGLALAAAAANALRMTGWRSLATRGRPMLWVLHAAFGWIVLGLALQGLAAFWPALPAPLATHALTIGGIGGLTLGMMSRVALGHTARPLEVAAPIVAGYALVNLAALVRVGLPLVWPQGYFTSLLVSGTLWTLAFAAFTAVYGPILTRPRLDGKPG